MKKLSAIFLVVLFAVFMSNFSFAQTGNFVVGNYPYYAVGPQIDTAGKTGRHAAYVFLYSSQDTLETSSMKMELTQSLNGGTFSSVVNKVYAYTLDDSLLCEKFVTSPNEVTLTFGPGKLIIPNGLDGKVVKIIFDLNELYPVGPAHSSQGIVFKIRGEYCEVKSLATGAYYTGNQKSGTFISEPFNVVKSKVIVYPEIKSGELIYNGYQDIIDTWVAVNPPGQMVGVRKISVFMDLWGDIIIDRLELFEISHGQERLLTQVPVLVNNHGVTEFFVEIDPGYIIVTPESNTKLIIRGNVVMGPGTFYSQIYFPGDSGDNMNLPITADAVEGNFVWTDFSQNPVDALNKNQWFNGVLISKFNEVQYNGDPGAVPVELHSFMAMVEDNNVIISWQTGSEKNNYGFSLQRRIAGENNWKAIEFINGAGTSSELHAYEYVDEDVPPGNYQYQLKQFDFDGSDKCSYIIEAVVSAPDEFQLFQNYPNPFNPSTTIEYNLPEAGRVSLIIYNALGQYVTTLIDEEVSAGTHQVQFTAPADMASGMYLYKLQTGKYRQAHKMRLLK